MFKNIFRKSPAKLWSIGIVYADARREYFATEEAYIAEAQDLPLAKDVANYIKKLGYKVALYNADESLSSRIQKNKPDLLINLADVVRGIDALSPCVPATLELTNTPYTGSSTLGLTIGSSKYLTKKLLELADIPTPRYQIFYEASEPLEPHLKFPVISKLNECHGSVALSEEAVSTNEDQLRKRLRKLISDYHQSVIVEEFFGNREVCAVVLDGPQRRVYMAEKVFGDNYLERTGNKVCTFKGKWFDEDSWVYKKYENSYLADAVKRAFEILKMRDYGKFDIRLDCHEFSFIDCNHNPMFGPPNWDTSITFLTTVYGISFEEILRRLLDRNAEDIALARMTEERTFASNLRSAKKDVMVMPQVTSII